MSPANEERPSLYEFMPYGAPELMEVAKKYMFRATMGGIGTIAGIFVIMFVTNLIIAQQEKAIPVVQMQVSDLAAPPPLSPGYQAKTMASRAIPRTQAGSMTPGPGRENATQESAPRRASRTPPTTPPAGPERIASLPRKRRALVRPPFDCMKRSSTPSSSRDTRAT